MTSGLALCRSQKYGSIRRSPCASSTAGRRAARGGRRGDTGSAIASCCQVEAASTRATPSFLSDSGQERNPRARPFTGGVLPRPSGLPARLHPALTVAVDLYDRTAAMPLSLFAKPSQEAQVAAIRRPQPAMRNLQEILLNLPDVRDGQAPVVPAEGAQIHQLVAGDSAG